MHPSAVVCIVRCPDPLVFPLLETRTRQTWVARRGHVASLGTTCQPDRYVSFSPSCSLSKFGEWSLDLGVMSTKLHRETLSQGAKVGKAVVTTAQSLTGLNSPCGRSPCLFAVIVVTCAAQKARKMFGDRRSPTGLKDIAPAPH